MKLLVFIVLALVGVSMCQTCDQPQCTARTPEFMEEQFDNCGREDSKYLPTADMCTRGSGFFADDVDKAIRDMFPEGKKYTDGLVTDTVGFVPEADGDAYITFHSTGAGYDNKFSLYYNDHGVIKFLDVFPYVNSFDYSCLKKGDTAKVPVKKDVKYGFALFPNYWNDEEPTLYSDVSIGSGLEASDGRGHAVWVKIGDGSKDVVVFGFEDKTSDSDYDYNDVLFTIQLPCGGDYTDIPVYDDGGIDKCLKLDTVTTTSYAEFQCSQYALLEMSEETACRAHLKPPTGWEIAVNDEKARNAVKEVTKWHKYDCIGVYDEDEDKFVGINKQGEDDSCEFDTKIREVDGEGCYRTSCEKRYLIKRIAEGEETSCGKSYGFCSTENEIVSKYPSITNDWLVYPNSIDYFISPVDDTSSEACPTSDFSSGEVTVNIRKASKLDIYIAVNREGLSKSEDISRIKTAIKNFYTFVKGLDGDDFVRVGVAGYARNSLSFKLLREEYTEKDIDDVITKSDSSSSFSDFVSTASKCQNCGWRDDSVRIVILANHNAASSSGPSSSLVQQAYENNNILVFVGVGTTDSYSSYANAFNANFKSAAYSSSSTKKRYENFLKNVDETLLENILDTSILKVVSGGNYAEVCNEEVDDLLDLSGVDTNKHAIQIKLTSGQEGNAVLNSIGRSQTLVHVSTNQAPIAYGGKVSVKFGDLKFSYTLSAFDPDGGKFSFKLTASDIVEFGTVKIYPKNKCTSECDCTGADEIAAGTKFEAFDQYEICVVLGSNEEGGSANILFTVDDGCDDSTNTIEIESSCDGNGDNMMCFVPQCPTDNQVYEFKKREIGIVPLRARYENGREDSITKIIDSIEGDDHESIIFKDRDLTSALQVDDQVGSFYYQSNVKFGNNLHVVNYRIYNTEYEGEEGLPVNYCKIRINVKPANDPPQYADEEFVINEDSEWIFKFDEQKVVYEENIVMKDRLIVKVKNVESARGNVEEGCDDASTCTNRLQACSGDCLDADGVTFDSTLPTFRFVPLSNDYDDDYVVVTFEISDKAQSSENRKTSEVKFTLHVKPVNDAPTIQVLGDIKVLGEGESGGMNQIEKGEEFVFSWKVEDIDTLPAKLQTTVTATPRTRLPWEAYACSGGEEECSNQLELAPSQRISHNVVVTTDCPSDQVLKQKRGDPAQLERCSATFTLRFVPEGSQMPYIQFSLQGFDGEDVSRTLQILLSVTPVNLPPTVWSPPEITSTSKVVNIRDGTNTVNTTDDAPALWKVKLFMDVDEEEEDDVGHFVIPTTAVDKCEVAENSSVTCIDNVVSINNWIKELRYNITADRNSVKLVFFVDDQGFPGIGSDGLVSDNSYTVITIDNSVVPAPPKSSSKLLIIALSVGAAGAIAVGVLVALLRNKLSPPTDDYFQIGTDTVSTSPQSPLYVGQTKEGFSGLYSGAKA